MLNKAKEKVIKIVSFFLLVIYGTHHVRTVYYLNDHTPDENISY